MTSGLKKSGNSVDNVYEETCMHGQLFGYIHKATCTSEVPIGHKMEFVWYKWETWDMVISRAQSFLFGLSRPIAPRKRNCWSDFDVFYMLNDGFASTISEVNFGVAYPK